MLCSVTVRGGLGVFSKFLHTAAVYCSLSYFLQVPSRLLKSALDGFAHCKIVSWVFSIPKMANLSYELGGVLCVLLCRLAGKKSKYS